jgi:hypothetical protein
LKSSRTAKLTTEKSPITLICTIVSIQVSFSGEAADNGWIGQQHRQGVPDRPKEKDFYSEK